MSEIRSSRTDPKNGLENGLNVVLENDVATIDPRDDLISRQSSRDNPDDPHDNRPIIGLYTAIGFPDSQLNGDDDAPAGTCAPGETLPDAPVGATHLSSLLGPQFTALVADAGEPVQLDAIRALAKGAVPVKVHAVNGVAAERIGALPGAAILVRPDGHVLARHRRLDPARMTDAVRRCCAGGTT